MPPPAPRLQHRPRPETSLFQAAWRLVVYLSLVVYGLMISFGKPWFKDPELVW